MTAPETWHGRLANEDEKNVRRTLADAATAVRLAGQIIDTPPDELKWEDVVHLASLSRRILMLSRILPTILSHGMFIEARRGTPIAGLGRDLGVGRTRSYQLLYGKGWDPRVERVRGNVDKRDPHSEPD